MASSHSATVGMWPSLLARAARLRAGQVNINTSPPDLMAPFGGYKQSGTGREWGDHAFAEILETKAILGAVKPG